MAQRLTVKRRLWVQFIIQAMNYVHFLALITRQSADLSSAAQHGMPERRKMRNGTVLAPSSSKVSFANPAMFTIHREGKEKNQETYQV